MMKHVVIGDIHARQTALRTLLYKIGVLKLGNTPDKDVRQEGFKLYQLGDAVSLGYGEKEAAFFRYFESILQDHDVVLLGNHEAQCLFGNGSMNFSGWEDRCAETEELVKSRWCRGGYVAAANVGGYLLTHAGLTTYHQGRMSELSLDETVNFLNEDLVRAVETSRWANGRDVICGMDELEGGILWARPGEIDTGLKQIFGHTPVGPAKYGNNWLLDTSTPDIEALTAKLARGERPMRSEFGSVAALVFDTEDNEPRLVTI